MEQRAILVLVDGLGYETAIGRLGYMEGLVSHGAARRWRMRAALPSLSRPCYETVHTGLTPHEHGITGNDMVRRSGQQSIFDVVRAAGGTTGAAAFSWFSELYNHAPYDAVAHVEVNDPALAIQHGRFYTHGDFPDYELFLRAAVLTERYRPDFLLVHPMGADTVGHRHGGRSSQYANQALEIDKQLAVHLPRWRQQGYTVFVTADHGMDEHGNHGGAIDIHTLVPFYHVGHAEGGIAPEDAPQTAVAPTVLKAMGLTPPPAMRTAALI